jgi:hypothetical protein
MFLNRVAICLFLAIFTFGILGSSGTFVTPAQGANTCPAMPPVPWWKKTHASVQKYVQRKYKGDWPAYTRKWVKARSKLADIYNRKKSIRIKSQQLVLGGDDLREYIENIDRRIRVIECLAKLSIPRAIDEELAVVEASYTCKPVPEVAWWGDLSHRHISSLVKRNYKGNWKKYIAYWEEEMSALMASFGLGQEAVVNKLGLALSNEELGLYVGKVAGMLAVVHCLADDARKK